MPNLTPLSALTPLDGRYREATVPLTLYLSEEALIRYRVFIECDYLRELGRVGIAPLSPEEDEIIASWKRDFSEDDAARIKELEQVTRHDVKAVEYWLRERAKGTSLESKTQWFHFGLTSEDINSVAYGRLLNGTLIDVVYPILYALWERLDALSKEHAVLPMLSRTHGQSATPTTFGKEMRVFADRLSRQLKQLQHMEIRVKFGGTTGTFGALTAAFPKIDWEAFADSFIAQGNAERTTFLLARTPATTQIEPHDSFAELFDTLRRVNVILLDLSQDMWRYISDGWLLQKKKDSEVGSSTMPHKVNPIDFENAEGNLGVANALFEFYSRKLPVSRLQRDLSDSTVERTFGEAFGHALVAYRALEKGLDKVSVNPVAIGEALDRHPEVLAEAIQTILRREGVADAYELLKDLTRGEQVTVESLGSFVDTLPVSDAVKTELKALTPRSYIGLAERIARES